LPVNVLAAQRDLISPAPAIHAVPETAAPVNRVANEVEHTEQGQKEVDQAAADDLEVLNALVA
jgi:hypothetical protein